MPRVVRVLPVLWLLLLGVTTEQRTPVWVDNVRLWTDAARKAPTKPRPLMGYASVLLNAGKLTESHAVSLEAFRQARLRVHDQRAIDTRAFTLLALAQRIDTQDMWGLFLSEGCRGQQTSPTTVDWVCDFTTKDE